jgi:hypothetical protein
MARFACLLATLLAASAAASDNLHVPRSAVQENSTTLDPLATWRETIKILPKDRKAAKPVEAGASENSTATGRRSRRDFKLKSVDAFKFAADLPGAIVFDMRDLKASSGVKAVHAGGGGSFTGAGAGAGSNHTAQAVNPDAAQDTPGGASDDSTAAAANLGDAGLSVSYHFRIPTCLFYKYVLIYTVQKDLGPCCDNTDCSPGSPAYAGDCNVRIIIDAYDSNLIVVNIALACCRFLWIALTRRARPTWRARCWSRTRAWWRR